jgi:hypothetical protein
MKNIDEYEIMCNNDQALYGYASKLSRIKLFNRIIHDQKNSMLNSDNFNI